MHLNSSQWVSKLYTIFCIVTLLLAACWRKKNERKRLQGHLINQLQLQVLLNQIFKVAGLLSVPPYVGAHMLSQGLAEM